MTVDNIIQVISYELGVDITKKNRGIEYVLGRAMFYDMAYNRLNLGSLKYLGSCVGVTHASVIHSIRNVIPYIKTHYKDYYVKYLSILNSQSIDDNKSSLEDRYNKLKRDYNDALSFMDIDKKNRELTDLVSSIIKLPEDKISKLKVRVDAIIHML
jgi:hypothetical protein